MAVEIRYVGNRGDNEWSSINYNDASDGREPRRQRVPERVQAGDGRTSPPTTPRASRTGSARSRTSAPAPAPARCRSIWRTSTAARTPATRPRTSTPSTTWANSDDRRPARGAEPEPDRRGGRSRRQPDSPQRRPWRLGYPANFFVLNPDVNNANVTDSGAFSKYNALQLELRRRLSKGFSANVNYQYAFEGGSQFDGFSFGRAWTDIPGDRAIPPSATRSSSRRTGRCRSAAASGSAATSSPVVNALVGRLERHRRRPATATCCRTFGNVRLVGHDCGRPAERSTSSTASPTRTPASTRSGCCRTT